MRGPGVFAVAVKSLGVVVVITPPMASEPYTAEAPSLRISIRSTIARGMVLRSTPVPWVTGESTARRPSMRISDREEPNPRRLTSAWPWKVLPEVSR